MTATIRPGSIFGMPEQASTIAPHVDLLYDIITWISVFFFVLIVGVMGYFVIRYRRTSHVAIEPTHRSVRFARSIDSTRSLEIKTGGFRSAAISPRRLKSAMRWPAVRRRSTRWLASGA
ncbi:MAG: hypothetical protein IIC08_00040 [Proteobacteria bacterium]|nr:hypothetical protein [Pseudomonadota bacterium]